MRTTIVLLIVGLLGASAAPAATRTDAGETAHATSLLTAERRAQEAAERLRLPNYSPARWKQGGTGWTPAWKPEAKRAPTER
jgi:type II secretory pathway pseudopilin PulG